MYLWQNEYDIVWPYGPYIGRFAMYTYLFLCLVVMTYQLLIFASDDAHAALCNLQITIKATLPDSNIMHTIDLNQSCPFTGRSIQDHLIQAQKHNSFFILGAYACDDSQKVSYADGKSLLTRLLLLQSPRQSVDPITQKRIAQTEFFECAYINDRLEMRAMGDISYAKRKGTLLYNTTRYLLAKDAEAALQQHDMLAQKLEEHNCSSLLSDDLCIINGQAAYQMQDLHRAYIWYQLADGKHLTSAQNRERLKEGCLEVAIACGLEKRALSISLLEKILSLGCSNEQTGEVAGRLSELCQDCNMKIFWMKKSARAGSIKGMCNLGNLYRQYRKDDIKKAIYWHHKTAESGALPGMVQLFCDIALEPQEHGIATDTLRMYADKLVETFNKGYSTDDQENYILNVFPKKLPKDYACALKMIKQYASIPMLPAVADYTSHKALA